MANYNSFIFSGHGISEVTGVYDPGATSGSNKEAVIAEQIVNEAINYLKPTGLVIQKDNNNFADKDLEGNTYTAKCGLVVHINAGGGTGTEIYVPAKESYLGTDFALVENISAELGIPDRSVKSRDYDTGNTVKRTNGVALNFIDYYAEIRDAWNRGISLSLLEVGFIDSSDIAKIKENIPVIGYYCALWVAENCGKKLEPPTIPKPPIYIVQAGSFSNKENADEQVKKLKNAGFDAFVKEI